MRTEPLRGRLLNTLLGQIQERTDPSATILAYGDCPMVYYASGRSAYRGLVWPRVYSEEYLETKLTDPSRDEPPALLVRYKRRGKGAKLIDQRIREAFRPRTVWQNLAFEILEPTIHAGGR